MKNLFLSIAISLFSILTFGQEYHKLINESFYWDIPVADMAYICQGYGENIPRRYSISGDTLINDTLYSKIYYSTFINTWEPPAPNCPPFLVDTNKYLYPNVYLREDTIEKKVWRRSEYSGDELLYDFSLQQGDSVRLPYFDNGIYVHIDTVYTITTNDGISRKKFEFSSSYPAGFYIEGIGGVAGLFQEPYFQYLFEGGPWLQCVKDTDNNSIWSKYEGLGCYNFIMDVARPNHYKEIKIYPNPFSDYIRVETSIKGLSVKIYDLFGHGIFSQGIINKQAIDLSDINSGIYILKIKDRNNTIFTKRIIKMEGHN
jgi:hypothetical protein